MTQAQRGQPQFLMQNAQSVATKIGHFILLVKLPDPFVRIEVRGVRRQQFQMDGLCRALGQELPDLPAPMNGRAIPNDQEPAAQSLLSALKKGHTFLTAQGVAACQGQKLPAWGDAAHHGKMVIGLRHLQHGRLSAGRVGPRGAWQEVKPRLVHKDGQAPFLMRLFFNRGQTVLRQSSI